MLPPQSQRIISKTTYKRNHSARCRFHKAVLTETAGKTLNFHHHLEIRGRFFFCIGLFSILAHSGFGQAMVLVSVVLLTPTLVLRKVFETPHPPHTDLLADRLYIKTTHEASWMLHTGAAGGKLCYVKGEKWNQSVGFFEEKWTTSDHSLIVTFSICIFLSMSYLLVIMLFFFLVQPS